MIKLTSILITTIFFVNGFVANALAKATTKDSAPNIILVNMDNFGYGELGIYGGGIIRGGATPRIDQLANEGIRLSNFNVEAQCTPSRAALLTGRYGIRSGNASVPFTTENYGLTQWEITLPELLSQAGYATAMYGKWHLGQTDGRFPTDQGFDEWYGIPNSTDESFWPSQPQFVAVDNEVPSISEIVRPEYIMKGSKGQPVKNVKIYDLAARSEIDRELTDLAKSYIVRQAKTEAPFFLYLPYTQTHAPNIPSKAFTGKSGNGNWGDLLMQIDAYVGELLDTIETSGITDNTIFIFTSDNGPEGVPGYQGWGGPWSGTYFTAKEGSLRVPFIARWPKHFPAGLFSNEIVHQMDLYATLANILDIKVPTDRIIDSIDQSDFFLGKKEKSNRDGFVIYVGETLFGVKWRNWKMLFKEFEGANMAGAIKTYGFPRFYNLYEDPRELYPFTQQTAKDLWSRWPMAKILTEHLISLKQEPAIKPGTPDPYQPK